MRRDCGPRPPASSCHGEQARRVRKLEPPGVPLPTQRQTSDSPHFALCTWSRPVNRPTTAATIAGRPAAPIGAGAGVATVKTVNSVGAGETPAYAPLVPTFSPYTAESAAAVRLAWRWTLAAFASLVTLLVGAPLARNWYVGAAIEPRQAEMTLIDGGAVFVQRRGAGDWVMAKQDDQLAPGDVLRTAANSRAFVRL